MSYLFIDTETTGLQNPRLVSVGAILTDYDGEEIDRYYTIVKPGAKIERSAFLIHGISTEEAKSNGASFGKVYDRLADMWAQADYIVGHNVNFDINVISNEVQLRRKPKLNNTMSICTMHSSVEYCKYPSYFGYKYPKLTELHTFLFGSSYNATHNAMADTEACMRCFFELKRRGVISLNDL